MQTSLTKHSELTAALASAETLEAKVDLHAKLGAIGPYLASRNASLDQQNEIAEARLILERQIGEVLAGVERESAGRPEKNASSRLTNLRATIKQIGISKQTAASWQLESSVPVEAFEAWLLRMREAQKEITSAGLVRLAKGKGDPDDPHVSRSTGQNEWYTTPEFIEAARDVMGSIDLDPASSAKANEIVKAAVFYTAEDNGLTKPWPGNVWINPPYSQPLIAQFAEALATKAEAFEFRQACVLVNNATETGWFQRMLRASASICLLEGRIRFLDQSLTPAKTPLQGQVILYFGDRITEFADGFGAFGTILHRRR